MKILVTGGLGFIGSHLTDALLRLGHQVVVFDNLDDQIHSHCRLPEYLNPEAELVIADVRNYDRLREVVCDRCEAVFHCAAAVGIGQSRYRIRHYCEVNQGGTANLFDILVNHQHSVAKVVVSASMASYGEGAYRCAEHGIIRPPTRNEEQMSRMDWELHCPMCGQPCTAVPIAEDSAQNCSSVYAINKMNQEQIALNVGMTYGLPVVALRYFNVYGPRQSLSNPYTGVSAIFMSRLKNNNRPVVYEDGMQTRDFISVHDVVRANILALVRASANFLALNVGSGEQTAIVWLARRLATSMGKEIDPDITGNFRKGDVRHCFAETSRVRRVLGFAPVVALEDGLDDLVRWSRNSAATDTFYTAEQELAIRGLVR